MKTSFIDKIYAKKTIKRINQKIKLMSITPKYDAYYFLRSRLILTISLLVIFTCFLFKYFYIYIPLVLIIYFMAEYFYIDRKVINRKTRIEKEAVIFFRLLLLNLNKTNDLKKALVYSLGNRESELYDIFRLAIAESVLGKNINDSLLLIEQYISSKSINLVITSLVEANKYNNDLISTLERQIDFLKDKLYLNRRSLISNLPYKILGLGFIFMIIVLGSWFIYYYLLAVL